MIIELCERTHDWWIDKHGEKRAKYHAQVAGREGVCVVYLGRLPR